MMKLLSALMLLTCLAACKQGESYKAIRTQVLSAHDKVMMDSEKAYQNKKALEELSGRLGSLKLHFPAIDTLAERRQIKQLAGQLTDAENQMNSWMEHFDAELGNKSNKDAVKYFKAEKARIKQIDVIYARAIKQSGEYIAGFNRR